MAERLTKKIVKTVQDKYSLGQYLYYDFAGLDDINKLLNKLGELEDILEKYGIESAEELDKKLAYYIDKIDLEAENEYLKKVIEKQNMISKIISKNRDTWQKACELACETMTKLGGDDCCGCRLNKEMCNICENKKALIDYFYQQAKTEGNDE